MTKKKTNRKTADRTLFDDMPHLVDVTDAWLTECYEKGQMAEATDLKHINLANKLSALLSAKLKKPVRVAECTAAAMRRMRLAALYERQREEAGLPNLPTLPPFTAVQPVPVIAAPPVVQAPPAAPAASSESHAPPTKLVVVTPKSLGEIFISAGQIRFETDDTGDIGIFIPANMIIPVPFSESERGRGRASTPTAITAAFELVIVNHINKAGAAMAAAYNAGHAVIWPPLTIPENVVRVAQKKAQIDKLEPGKPRQKPKKQKKLPGMGT
jgi:hypothetical protein